MGIVDSKDPDAVRRMHGQRVGNAVRSLPVDRYPTRFDLHPIPAAYFGMEAVEIEKAFKTRVMDH